MDASKELNQFIRSNIVENNTGSHSSNTQTKNKITHSWVGEAIRPPFLGRKLVRNTGQIIQIFPNILFCYKSLHKSQDIFTEKRKIWLSVLTDISNISNTQWES